MDPVGHEAIADIACYEESQLQFERHRLDEAESTRVISLLAVDHNYSLNSL